MRLCATYNNATKQFVATLARGDGTEAHVWFASSEGFRAWLEALEAKVEGGRQGRRRRSGAAANELPDERLGAGKKEGGYFEEGSRRVVALLLEPPDRGPAWRREGSAAEEEITIASDRAGR